MAKLYQWQSDRKHDKIMFEMKNNKQKANPPLICHDSLARTIKINHSGQLVN